MASRRDFLKISSLASAAFLTPGFLQKLAETRPAFKGKRLVVVQLSGGNDGLNAFVPYANDLYYQNRPGIGIPRQEVLTLTGDLGLNPALAALRPLYDQGWLSVVSDVGYPNPDRSHFRALDIWHSASDASDYWTTGWLGRYLDAKCATGGPDHKVIEVDETLSLAVKGTRHRALAVKDPDRLYKSSRGAYIQMLNQAYGKSATTQPDLDYLYKTLTSTTQSAEYLKTTLENRPESGAYPGTDLGKQLRMVGSLIGAGFEASVYYVSLSGFDTHANQRGQQERTLKTYAESVAAFVEDLRRMGAWDDTVVLTFSEFGRRVKQNASAGTDHGKANTLWVMGKNLQKPGLVNGAPQLHTLDDGDLSFRVDFRQVYAGLLGSWLEADDKQILGRTFEKLVLA